MELLLCHKYSTNLVRTHLSIESHQFVVGCVEVMWAREWLCVLLEVKPVQDDYCAKKAKVKCYQHSLEETIQDKF